MIIMKLRASALMLAQLAILAALAPSAAQAQGLRVSPQIGASRSGQALPPTGPQQADYIVAVVNSEPVTNYEVRSRVARIEQQPNVIAARRLTTSQPRP